MRPPAKALLQRALFIVISTLMLSWPLFYNRFPIVYGDSLLYSLTGFTGRSMAFRPSCYPYILAASGIFKSVQPVCIFQSLLTVLALDITLRRGARLGWWPALAVVAGLALLTTLPWWTSALMPDIFFGIAILSAGTLAFGCDLTLADRIVLWCLLAISVVEHVALPPPLLVLAVLLILMYVIRRRRPTATSVGILVVAIAGFFSYPALNALTGNAFAPSDNTARFIFCRMAGDGLVDDTDMLHFTAAAPERQAKLLAQFHAIDALPANIPVGYLSAESARTSAFVHDADSPFMNWSTDRRLPTFNAMLLRIIKRKPLKNVVAIAAGTVRFLCAGEIPLFVESLHPSPPLPILPRDTGVYDASRQNHNTLHLAAWNIPIIPLYWLGTAAGIAALLIACWKGAAWKSFGIPLIAFILTFDLLHAAIVFALSGDFPRYQSRISWIVVLGAFLAILSVLRTMPTKKYTEAAALVESGATLSRNHGQNS